jgi:hypothetical protein
MSPPGKDLWWFWTGLTPSYPEDGWEVARKTITDMRQRIITEHRRRRERRVTSILSNFLTYIRLS